MRNHLNAKAVEEQDPVAAREVEFWVACGALARYWTWGSDRACCLLLGGTVDIIRSPPGEYRSSLHREIYARAFEYHGPPDKMTHEFLAEKAGSIIPRELRYPRGSEADVQKVKAIRQEAVAVKRPRRDGPSADASAGGVIGSSPFDQVPSAAASSSGTPGPNVAAASSSGGGTGAPEPSASDDTRRPTLAGRGSDPSRTSRGGGGGRGGARRSARAGRGT